MTRKHFEALAAMVRETPLTGVVEGRDMANVREHFAHTLADFCQDQNSRFDREKFLAACGIRK